jgi:hypothetical protein
MLLVSLREIAALAGSKLVFSLSQSCPHSSDIAHIQEPSLTSFSTI